MGIAEQMQRFKIERAPCWNADIVWQPLPKLRARSLSAFAGGPAVPQEAAIYAAPSAAFTRLIESRPPDRKAIERRWDVYVVGSDLRLAYPSCSPTIAPDLIRWSAEPTRGERHLATHLLDFAADYERIRADFAALPERRTEKDFVYALVSDCQDCGLRRGVVRSDRRPSP